MQPANLKKMYQLIKRSYALLEEQALKEGVDITSPQYDALKTRARDNVLKKWGFDFAQYQAADQAYKDSKGKIQDSIVQDGVVSLSETVKLLQEHATRLAAVESTVKSLPIPNHSDITSIAHDVAKQYIVPPVVTNQIVKEVTVKEPTVVKETVMQTVHVPFDEKPLNDKLSALSAKVEAIKMPEIPLPPDLEKFRSEVMEQQSVSLAKSIDILGMPDFRKLAMGLRGDIDALSIHVNSGASSFPPLTQAQINALTPTNGQTAYNTTTDSPQIYIAGSWYALQVA